MEAAETSFRVPQKGGLLGTGPAQANVTTTVIATPEDQSVLSSAVQFAENTVQGAASLTAGVVITGAELYVGIGAKILDAAGNLVRRGVGAMCYVQDRGHRATAGAVETVKNTVNSVQQRGNEVLARSVSVVLPTTATEEGFGIEGYTTTGTRARPRAESGGGPEAGVFQAASQTVKQALGTAGEIAGTTSKAVGTPGQKPSGTLRHIASAATGLVAETFHQIEHQGEKAAETFGKGVETAGQAAHTVAGSASEAVEKAGGFVGKESNYVGHQAATTAAEIERAGESTAASALEHAREGAEKTAAAARATAETAHGASRSMMGTVASSLRNIVKGTLKEVEKQGEDVISSSGGVSPTAKESLSHTVETIEGGTELAAAKAKDTSAKAKDTNTRREKKSRSSNPDRETEQLKVSVQATTETKKASS